MTIAFNGMTLSGQKSGVGYYTYNLLKALWSIDPINDYVGWVSKDCEGDKLLNSANVHLETVGVSIHQSFRHLIWEHFSLARRMKQGRPIDLFFSPAHSIPLSGLTNIPKVVTTHDLSYIHYPDTKSRQFRVYMNWMMQHMVRHAEMIIVDSKQTQRDMMEIMNVSADRLITIYLAASEHFRNPVSDEDLNCIRQRYALGDNVILAVGDIEPRKNMARLIEAFAVIRQEHETDLQLTLIGRPKRGLGTLQKLIIENGLADHVVLTGYVPDEDLAGLYRLARVFVYPSLYEGFGIPPLEAMMSSTPVVASNVSSIPEIVGDAAVLVDPNSVQSIADGINRILSHPSFARDLVAKGHRQSRLFSWESTARETLQVFETVNGNS